MFILDSNIFIEAKNRYYAFDIAPVFWTWIDELCQNNTCTISLVRDELLEGDDELAEWIKERRNDSWILPVDDVPTQQAFADIAQHVADSDYKDSAKNQFLAKADPWLVAKAKTTQATLVTHEVPDTTAKRRVPLPNICADFGVSYLNTFDFLRQHSKVFS